MNIFEFFQKEEKPVISEEYLQSQIDAIKTRERLRIRQKNQGGIFLTLDESMLLTVVKMCGENGGILIMIDSDNPKEDRVIQLSKEQAHELIRLIKSKLK